MVGMRSLMTVCCAEAVLGSTESSHCNTGVDCVHFALVRHPSNPLHLCQHGRKADCCSLFLGRDGARAEGIA